VRNLIKIGIIGSDNTHSEYFSQLINIPDKNSGEYFYPEYRVTGIFGLDKQRTEQVAHDGKIDFIAEKPDDLLGKVDAIMVVFRHGDLHLEYSLPFIEARIPTWIDKPFTIKNEDARKLINTAKDKGTLLTGGSCCKHIYDVLLAQKIVETGGRIGALKSAVINFPADLVNIYGGLFFYGSHQIEMCIQIFGSDPRSVIASESNGCVMAIVKYDKFQISMNFIPGSKENYIILYGENGIATREIDMSMYYTLGMNVFTGMIRDKKLPVPLEQLYAAVELTNGVVESYKTTNEVYLKQW
jgi:predicted dehydrogenase